MADKKVEGIKNPDRISYSFARKISLERFTSVDVHVSYSTDVAPEESPDEATKRARKHVHRWVEHELGSQEKARADRVAARKTEIDAGDAALDEEIERQAVKKGK